MVHSLWMKHSFLFGEDEQNQKPIFKIVYLMTPGQYVYAIVSN